MSTKILLVCLGNICRSPMAAGILKHKLQEQGRVAQIEVASAGTSAYHEGRPADLRACTKMQEKGLDIGAHRARAITFYDFIEYDQIIAMDYSNLHRLKALSPAEYWPKIRLLMSFVPGSSVQEVPDPYEGGLNGFEHSYHLIEQGIDGLLRSAIYPE